MKEFNWESGKPRIKLIGNSIKLKGSGVQNLNLFLLLPQLDNEIDRQSDDFKLYFYARRIVNFFLSPIIYRKDLKKVKKEIHLF